MKSDGKEKGIEQELTGELAKRIQVEIHSASETCLLIAEADRVLSHFVMFLPVFLHWIYKMKYSCYRHSFVILGWLVYWVVVETRTTKRNWKSSFSKISYS